MKNIITILFIALFSNFIFGQESAKTQDLLIADKTVDCTGVAKQKCLVVRDGNSGEWQYFYTQIKGFKFRENYTQKIRVKITPKENVPADASAFDYKLVRTLNRSKTDGDTLKEAQNQMGNPPSGTFTKNRWTLVEINEKSIEGKKPVLSFDEKKSSFGTRICNSIGGNYTLKGSKLKFSNVISTMMACADESLMSSEMQFGEAIRKVTKFEQKENSLIFFANNTPVLKFIAENQAVLPEKSFENIKWNLTDIGSKKVSAAVVPFLQFDKEKMRASGSGGCNRLFSGYKINDQSLTFGAVGMTKMACAGEKMQIEREFSRALSKVNRFELNDGKLILFEENIILLKFEPAE